MTATAAPAPRLAERIRPTGEYEASNALLKDPPALRARLAESGYLFFRGALDRERLLDARLDILKLCRAHGWIMPGSDLRDGVYSGIPFPDHPAYNKLYRELLELDSFNGFAVSPEILRICEAVLDGPVQSHRRTIARVSFPRHYVNTTQPHQDFFYIRGTPQTYTAWIPCGDCPNELGGLALLEGSHAQGFLPHVPAIGAGNHGIPTAGWPNRWLTTDYRAGDFVLFHSHTIHGALDNHTPDRLRVSFDFRYQRQGEAIDPGSLRSHLGLLEQEAEKRKA